MKNFQIEEVVEQTSAFAIYKVLDEKTGVRSVLKQYVVKEDSRLHTIPDWQKDFREIVANFSSVNIPYLRSVVGGDVDYLQGRPYVLYNSLPARSLTSIIEDTPNLGLDNGVKIGMALLEAVIQIEKMGLVHGLISPDTVYYKRTNEHNPWILDWDPLSALENKYNVADIKIDDYTAPELLSGLHPTSRSDIYSIGKVMESVLGENISDSHIKKWVTVATTMSKYNRFKHPQEAFIYLTNRNVTKQNMSTATVAVSQTKSNTELVYIQTQPRTLKPDLVPQHEAPVVNPAPEVKGAAPEPLFPPTKKAVERETAALFEEMKRTQPNSKPTP